ncbi:ABC transporter permease [Sulfobacillus harzensis]|uniref:FtsX-like permease family protein n=1 Tax=Sulfobacillus harzensis TaxID=2729629 RepID=A0A7Y0L7S3_9FIRM|nr:ABC transporter permease [Sulfobacillus harzensis]NMP24775.1 FtsX-like permease family protein [Sulfobacillus harzensis]
MIGQTLKISVRAIWTQKVRSILTMLGVIIGVGAVIALVSLGNGAQQSINKNIEGLGSNLIVANVGYNPFSSGFRGGGAGPTTSATGSPTQPQPLTTTQVTALANTNGVRQAAPVLSGNATLGVGASTLSSSVDGTNGAYASITGYHVAQGRFLSALDVQAANPVIVLGSGDAQTLFGRQDPIGDIVNLNGVPFHVVGVLAAKATSAGKNPNDLAVIPWTTYSQVFGSTGITEVDLSAGPHANVNAVVARLDQKLLRWTGSTQDFTVTAQSQILSTLSSVNRVETLLLGGVASISLIVGGIGIMNIMLVSVTERTREIGIRKAVGASTRDIMAQFLIESLVLSGLGGLLGVAAGVGFSHVMSGILKSPTAVSVPTTALAFGFALGVGLIFGLWPAMRAALMRPAQALRVD